MELERRGRNAEKKKAQKAKAQKQRAYEEVQSRLIETCIETKTYENHFKGAFHWPYSGIGMRRFSSKNHACENFAVIGIQRRLAISFSNKMLFRNCPVFSFKEKSQRLLRLFSFQNRPLSCSRHVGFETRLAWHKQCTQNKLCILKMTWALFMPVQPRFKSKVAAGSMGSIERALRMFDRTWFCVIIIIAIIAAVVIVIVLTSRPNV